MSLTRLTGGILYDPANGVNGERRDLYFRDGRIIDAPAGAAVDHDYDAHGMVVMTGGIALQSHIGGGKTTPPRPLVPEGHRADRPRDAASDPARRRRTTACADSACRRAASARRARSPPATVTRK